jgi:hypothetical protein
MMVKRIGSINKLVRWRNFMFIIITVDKYLVKDVTQYNSFESAIGYAIRYNTSNPNAQSIEILSRANGALIRKVK